MFVFQISGQRQAPNEVPVTSAHNKTVIMDLDLNKGTSSIKNTVPQQVKPAEAGLLTGTWSGNWFALTETIVEAGVVLALAGAMVNKGIMAEHAELSKFKFDQAIADAVWENPDPEFQKNLGKALNKYAKQHSCSIQDAKDVLQTNLLKGMMPDPHMVKEIEAQVALAKKLDIAVSRLSSGRATIPSQTREYQQLVDEINTQSLKIMRQLRTFDMSSRMSSIVKNAITSMGMSVAIPRAALAPMKLAGQEFQSFTALGKMDIAYGMGRNAITQTADMGSRAAAKASEMRTFAVETYKEIGTGAWEQSKELGNKAKDYSVATRQLFSDYINTSSSNVGTFIRTVVMPSALDAKKYETTIRDAMSKDAGFLLKLKSKNLLTDAEIVKIQKKPISEVLKNDPERLAKIAEDARPQLAKWAKSAGVAGGAVVAGLALWGVYSLFDSDTKTSPTPVANWTPQPVTSPDTLSPAPRTDTTSSVPQLDTALGNKIDPHPESHVEIKQSANIYLQDANAIIYADRPNAQPLESGKTVYQTTLQRPAESEYSVFGLYSATPGSAATDLPNITISGADGSVRYFDGVKVNPVNLTIPKNHDIQIIFTLTNGGGFNIELHDVENSRNTVTLTEKPKADSWTAAQDQMYQFMHMLRVNKVNP